MSLKDFLKKSAAEYDDDPKKGKMIKFALQHLEKAVLRDYDNSAGFIDSLNI